MVHAFNPCTNGELMPWQVKHGAAGCKGFAVVKQSDGSLVGCHPTRTAANAHLKALYSSEAESKKIKKTILGDNKWQK